MADEKVEQAKPTLSIPQILEDLKNGIERFPNKADASQPSIQEKYGLRRVDVINLFKNADLKGKKVHTGKSKAGGGNRKPRATIGFVLVDADGKDVTPTLGTSDVTAAPSAGNSEASAPSTVDSQVSTPAVDQAPVEENSGW